MTTTSTKTASQQQYPDFVAYHFLNAKGELLAMEEDGHKTDKFLQEGFTVDGSSIGGDGNGSGSMASVEHSDLWIRPIADSYTTMEINPDNDGSSGNNNNNKKNKNANTNTKPTFHHACFKACEILTDQGQPHPMDPRAILQRQVRRAHMAGYEPYMFSEVEFYILDEATHQPIDHATYCSLPPADKSYHFRHALGKLCQQQLGMAVKRIHHENGPGQNELELDLQPCLKNADDTVLAMWLMQLLADRHGQVIDFSPKPVAGEAGNGLHHHILLRDVKTGENVFQAASSTTTTTTSGSSSDGDDDDKTMISSQLSPTAQYAIAGLLKYAKDITAVFCASHASWERLQPGYEAPNHTAWGFANRTALVRVPKITCADTTRIEYRGADASGSVHLLGAVLLAAVLQGIAHQLPLPPPADFNVEEEQQQQQQHVATKNKESFLAQRGIYPVPQTVEECIQVLQTSEFLRDEAVLGPDMVDYLIQRDVTLLAETKPPN